jgi:hypothetical protein
MVKNKKHKLFKKLKSVKIARKMSFLSMLSSLVNFIQGKLSFSHARGAEAMNIIHAATNVQNANRDAGY